MADALFDPQASQAICKTVTSWLDLADNRQPKLQQYERLPCTSRSRRLESLADKSLEFTELEELLELNHSTTKETVLYLAYGSNLSVETFRGKRGIKPLSQINVIVPQLVATFDLAGVPYAEPCFANTRYRQPDTNTGKGCSEKDQLLLHSQDHHKDRWHKGLVGVVYEVTKEDYAHIIATEGGGAGYQDVVVDCYVLSGEPTDEVPLVPKGETFKSHTLFSPPMIIRPDPSYAQPSARYLKLITDGAEECSLPFEYQTYLKSIRTYEPRSTKQKLGQFIFLATWMPTFAVIFGGGTIFLDKKGRYPAWYIAFTKAIFVVVWASYDNFFKAIFGDGERSTSKSDDATADEEALLESDGKKEYRTKECKSASSGLPKNAPVY